MTVVKTLLKYTNYELLVTKETAFILFSVHVSAHIFIKLIKPGI